MIHNVFDYISILDNSTPCSDPILNSKTCVPIDSIEFLFSLTASLSLNENTKYLAFHILSRLNNSKCPKSLVLISIFLASKMNDITPVKFSQLKIFSNVSVSEFKNLEKWALNKIEYKILDFTVFDWVNSFIELSFGFNLNAKKEIKKTAVYIIDFVYREYKILMEISIGLIAAGILNVALILNTRCIGEFLPIVLLSRALHQDINEINRFSVSLLKLALGEEFCNRFNFF